MNKSGGLKAKGKIKRSSENKPLVSIITPVFNGKAYLEQTIQSVLGQTYDNIEYIVIDGGSTDGSLELIQKYDDQLDYWLSEPDSGMYDAINKGLKTAAGDIFAYLNSDDLYHPDSVKSAVEYFWKHPGADMIYGHCDFLGPNGEFLYHYHYPRFKFKSFVAMNTSTIPQQTTFWRGAIHKKIGYFDTALKMCGDFDFYAKAGKSCRVDHTKKNLARFRIHEASLTSRQGYRNQGEVDLIHKRYCRTSGIPLIFLRNWMDVKLKLLNIPTMFRKIYLYSKKLNFR